MQDFRMALDSLKNNKVRSFLTMFEIVISVAAVIVMVGAMQGQSRKNESAFLQGDIQLITIDDYSGGSKVLTEQDYLAFYQENKHLISGLTPRIFPSPIPSIVGSTGKSPEYPMVYMVSEMALDLFEWRMISGRFLTYGEIAGKQACCAIGNLAAESIYGEGYDPQKVAGDQITIGGRLYRITGVFDGDDAGSTYGMVIPYSFVEDYGIRNWANVTMKARTPGDVAPLKNAVDAFMREYYTEEEINNLMITNQLDQVHAYEQYLMKQGIRAASLAGIALVVAGVGVMNIMLISVTERTREIGIRKSLGAKRWVIMTQFMFEAALLSTLAGLIGIVLGIAIMGVYIRTVDSLAQIVPWSVGLAFAVSVGMGLIFGYMPASKASHLKPIDALKG